MNIGAWLNSNWFNLLQSLGIIFTLLITVYSNQKLVKSRRLTNYLQLTQFHRQIWLLAMESPDLYRVVSHDPSLEGVEITQAERQFISFLFLHTTCAFELANDQEVVSIEGMKEDVKSFMQAPMVKRFWSEQKKFFNSEFVRFVDECVTPRYSTSVYLYGSKAKTT